LIEAHLVWLAQPAHRKAVAIAARILGRMLTKADIILSKPKISAVPATPVLQIVA
jgi:hypothetical protein